MAAKSPTELIREVRNDLNLVTERVDALRRDAEPLRTASGRLSSLEVDVSRHAVTLIRERLAKLEERSDKLVKDRDESSRRWLQIAIFAAGAVLTIVVQLVIRSLPTK